MCVLLLFLSYLVNVTQPIAIAAITISKEYSYDYRRGFFGHFVVNISWDNPPGT